MKNRLKHLLLTGLLCAGATATADGRELKGPLVCSPSFEKWLQAQSWASPKLGAIASNIRTGHQNEILRLKNSLAESSQGKLAFIAVQTSPWTSPEIVSGNPEGLAWLLGALGEANPYLEQRPDGIMARARSTVEPRLRLAGDHAYRSPVEVQVPIECSACCLAQSACCSGCVELLSRDVGRPFR